MNNEETRNEVAINNEALTAAEVFEGNTAQLISSDPSDDFIAQAENANVFGKQAEGLKQAVNKKLNITKYVAGNVELTDDETGETFPALRVVLVTADGEVYSTESKSAVRQLGSFVNIMKRGGLTISEKTPLPVKVVLNKTRNGFDALGLELDTAKLRTYKK